MAYFATSDGTRLFYKDWGSGQPILFSHGWPLSSDAWDQQMLFFGQHGFRVIVHDRRRHGRSDQTWGGNHINQYADDLAELGLQGGTKGQYDWIHEFSEIDYTDDLRRMDRPTQIIHGDDDQIAPIDASARLAHQLLTSARLHVCAGGSHGLAETEAERFNADVLKFITS